MPRTSPGDVPMIHEPGPDCEVCGHPVDSQDPPPLLGCTVCSRQYGMCCGSDWEFVCQPCVERDWSALARIARAYQTPEPCMTELP